MTMLDTFFNIRKNSTAYFAGLEIAQEPDLCSKWMNQWSVLFLTLKDRTNRRAIIIEVKRSKTEKRMPKDCEAALEQIDREKYTVNLLKGYKTILCYGAAFFEKSCIIKYSKNKERNSS